MKQRVLAGGAAVGIAAIVVIVALVAGGGGGGPRALPVLGAGGGVGEAATADAMSSPVGGGGGPGYEFTGDASGLPAEADAWSVDRADGEARARVLAEALGVGELGELGENGEQWTAESADGFLTVDRQLGLPWYYSAVLPQVDPVPPGPEDGCTAPTVTCLPAEEAADADATCTDGADCDPEPCPDDTASCPSEDAVEPGSAGGGEAGVDTAACSKGDPGCPQAPAPVPGEAPAIDCAMPECPPGTACTQVCPEPGPDGSVEPVPVPEPQRPADLPSAEEAEVIARGFLDDAGMSLDGARTRVDDGFSSWVFVADPVVGGLPTFGMSTSVGVGSGGDVEFANGWLSDPVEGDTYDLVGVDAALDRLAETGGWFAYAPASPDDCPDCEELPELEPTELDAVEVGLQLVPAYGAEEAWLVPIYLFTIADGGPGAVVAAFAIADEHLVEPQVDEPILDDGGDSGPIPVEPDGGIGDGAGPPKTVEETAAAPLLEGERAMVGVGYYVEVPNGHCGVFFVEFDGRVWDLASPLPEGSPTPGWGEPYEGGTMTLLSPDEAEFVGDAARTKVARFVARTDPADGPGCA